MMKQPSFDSDNSLVLGGNNKGTHAPPNLQTQKGVTLIAKTKSKESDDKKFGQFSNDDDEKSISGGSSNSVEEESQDLADEHKDDVMAINNEINSVHRKNSGKLQRGFTVD